MASSADVREIMGLGMPGGQSEVITKEMILGTDKPKKFAYKKADVIKRPEGMPRELYNLLYNDSKDAPPIIPTDSTIGKGRTISPTLFSCNFKGNKMKRFYLNICLIKITSKHISASSRFLRWSWSPTRTKLRFFGCSVYVFIAN